jgi:hypothetical protein
MLTYAQGVSVLMSHAITYAGKHRNNKRYAYERKYKL